jgi:alkylhydroperoxidase family enzyme
LKAAFDKQRELFGDLLNPTKVLAHCPPILRAAGLMGLAFEQSAQLPKGMLPLIYLRVASINGCPF